MATSSNDTRIHTGTNQVFDIPPGYESQPKLALNEEPIVARREKPPLPDDSS